VLLVFCEVTVGHLAYGTLHIADYHLEDLKLIEIDRVKAIQMLLKIIIELPGIHWRKSILLECSVI
jgi:hypothetical protein